MGQESREGFPLSPGQKHLWCLEAGPQPHRVQCAVALDGPLDRNALRKACQSMLERHEILRTTFHCLPGTTVPLQVIGDAVAVELPEHDLTALAPLQQDERIGQLLRDARQAPFDCASGPLLRLALATLAPNRHVLLVTLPALCADAASLTILTRELSQVYEAGSDGLDTEVMQYADISAWQIELLGSEEGKQGAAFWRSKAVPRLTSLPIAGHASTTEEFAPELFSAQLASEQLQRLEAFAEQTHASPADVLLACWVILLGRWSGQQDVIVKAAFDGRRHAELGGAIGLLTKYLPLAAHLQEKQDFGAVLDQVRRSVQEAAERQEFFAWGSPADAQDNGPGDSQIVGFEYADFRGEYRIGEATWSLDSVRACLEPFALRLACVRYRSGLATEWHYDARALTTAEVERMAERLATLLEGVLSKPETAIGLLPIVGKNERRLLLEGRNNTREVYPIDATISELIAAQVARSPDRIAVVVDDRRLTCRELDARSNQLAHHLVGLGVGSEVLVGLCLDRSLESVIGILGILKAGGAYVPLDPEYPRARNAFVLGDARVQVLLTQERLRGEFAGASARVVCLDTDWPTIAGQSSEPLPVRASLDNLAYVIYTSGTTGNPKGVMIPHSNLAHYVQALQTPLGITSNDAYLHTASLAFSSSVRQLLVPLAQGARVVIATTEQRREPAALFELIKKEGVTIIDLVPSYWRSCVNALNQLPDGTRQTLLANSLRLCLSASEALGADVPRAWMTQFQNPARFVNMFGHTETTGIVGTFPISAPPNEKTRIVPLGRPIANTRIYLLDGNRQLVPYGCVGEVCIGGPGLARGYLHLPELTADRFVTDPFKENSRLYRTGDLARYLASGDLEYLGRIDHQVKVRGHRVEVAEIEAQLCRHPEVRESTVVAREDTPQETRLVAYVISRSGTTPSPEELRLFLKEKLPDYMVPSAFVALDAMPLTPNGKLDRRALPAPDQARPEMSRVFAPPRNPVEDALAKIWAEVLTIERVGIHDNFFDLGGHSLLATRLMSRVRDTFKVQLPLRSLFEATTVAELARLLVANEAKPGQIEKIARVLKKLETMSAEDAKEAVLRKKRERGLV